MTCVGLVGVLAGVLTQTVAALEVVDVAVGGDITLHAGGRHLGCDSVLIGDALEHGVALGGIVKAENGLHCGNDGVLCACVREHEVCIGLDGSAVLAVDDDIHGNIACNGDHLRLIGLSEIDLLACVKCGVAAVGYIRPALCKAGCGVIVVHADGVSFLVVLHVVWVCCAACVPGKVGAEAVVF